MAIKGSLTAAMAVIALASGWAWGATYHSYSLQEVGQWQGYPVFMGWDAYSFQDQTPQVCASDWQCGSTAPVQYLAFYGSYLDWAEAAPPGPAHGFVVTFWDDVPAGADPRYPAVDWSHPGQPLHTVTVQEFHVEFIGWEVDPCNPGPPDQPNVTDATFKCRVALQPEDCFFQQQDSIY
ncbi:MAG: hypothetical protein AMJ81_14180 [Phycisphaerae bacterium SM23_33]|jgi:hypothetical protein|nr:MAG: hypothetical protein AMJ81_14180 [Phycisphaerae bacterium SM23_33]